MANSIGLNTIKCEISDLRRAQLPNARFRKIILSQLRDTKAPAFFVSEKRGIAPAARIPAQA